MGGLEPPIHGGPTGGVRDGPNDGQQGGDLGGTEAVGRGDGGELLLAFDGEIDQRVGIAVELAEFVRARAKALAELLAHG